MGKFADKFMSAFNSSSDDDFDEYDDEMYDEEPFDEDEFQEAEPPKSRGGVANILKRKMSQPEDREPVRETREEKAPAARTPIARPSKPAPAPRSTNNARMSGNEVCIFKPSSIEDSREITETLLQGKAVVINFEGLHVEISQRIIDFISGSCYALDGNLQKISNYIFIATPNSVDISGDFQDLFGGDNGGLFDVDGFNKSPLI